MIAVLFVPQASHAAGLWDVLPTPLMRMQDAGVPTTVEAISNVLADATQEDEFRYWAAMALGQLGDERAIPWLISSLSDQKEIVRAGAASALHYLPSAEAVQPLCETALHDEDMAPRHNAVNALSSVMTNAATTCLVRVAAKVQETKKVRLQSLILLEQQTQERQGFEELIPTLEDRDPDVKGMAAIILSIEYANEPQVLESLSVTESLVDAALNAELDSWIYLRMVERLETIADRKFVGVSDEEREVMIPSIRAEINNRIMEWTKEVS